MSDCIDREAAIVALANNRCGNDEWDLAVTHDVETVKKLPSVEPESKWIPVSEMYPEVSDAYLVTIEYKGEVIGTDVASFIPLRNYGYIDNCWNTFNDWKEDYDEFYHVTAWMPLPEPYKAESEDAE